MMVRVIEGRGIGGRGKGGYGEGRLLHGRRSFGAVQDEDEDVGGASGE